MGLFTRKPARALLNDIVVAYVIVPIPTKLVVALQGVAHGRNRTG